MQNSEFRIQKILNRKQGFNLLNSLQKLGLVFGSAAGL